MQETYLAACLEAGFKTIKSRRLSTVGKCPEFTLLEKPWKDLVKLAVLETELPGQDEEGEAFRPLQDSGEGVAEVNSKQRLQLQKKLLQWIRNLLLFASL